MIELSELQIALIAIGVVIILAVVGYNLSKARKRRRSNISSSIEVGAEQQRLIEPTLNTPVDLNESFVNKPLATHTADEQGSDLAPSGSNNGSIPRIDPAIDSVVLLRFQVPISGDEVLAHLAKWPKNTPYRCLIEGLGGRHADIDTNVSLEWAIIQPQIYYQELQLGIQLANRRGPIGVIDLSEFMSRCQELADNLDAEIDLPPVNEVLEQAKLIDQFCLTADIQLGFQVMANMISWDVNDVARAIQYHGFILSRDGSYFNFYKDDSLLFRAQVEGINFLRDDLENKRVKQIHFLLDVPLSLSQAEPFTCMLQKANELALNLDGRLLDDNGQALTAEAIEVIQGHLNGIYDLMKSRDIIPGSASAQRLFS